MIKRIILSVCIALFLFIVSSLYSNTFAQTGSCIDSGTGQIYCIGDTCPSIASCSPPTHSNVCCVPGNTDPTCSSESTWAYNYNYQCTINQVGIGSVSCTWQWQSQQCAAVDNCTTGPYLEAGICGSTGCAVGGTYKTCCAGGTLSSNSCIATTPSVIPNGGVCPNGTTPVQCGGAGQPACGQAACATLATPTPTPTPTPTGCSGAPTFLPPPNSTTANTPCDPTATSCTIPCTKTCTDNSGKQCTVSGQSVWACQGGTQWFNDGRCWASCPVSCNASQCQGNQTQTICGQACTLPRP